MHIARPQRDLRMPEEIQQFVHGTGKLAPLARQAACAVAHEIRGHDVFDCSSKKKLKV